MMQSNLAKRYSMDDIEFELIQQDQCLPLVIKPIDSSVDIVKWGESNKVRIKELLTEYGGILFRGFKVSSSDVFEDFIESVSSSVLSYTERSSPRSAVSGNIYTSTDHPEDKEIFLHSEQSYNLQFPMRIFFYCEKAARSGGATPIADARKIFQRIDPQLRSQFKENAYRYSRCFWPMMGINWQTAFQTSDKQSVEKYLQENQINFEWGSLGELKTYQTRPLVAEHPDSGEKCWFNHCTFFNVSTLDTQTQEMLLSSFAQDELPNNTYYSDGTPIEPEVMDALREAYLSEKVEFEWQQGDVLMLDNMLVTHGRGTFEGDRSVLVGMSEVCSWEAVKSENIDCKSLRDREKC
ncbi:TauD/TfdA family dioxygenase [Pseudoalteromonas maricaloris]|uniref:TauD/TfdA family dioxygenase n=1 Tax=Pseudoalteromonas maricaloris TaxID=184924 RepID=UPI003C25FF5D